MATNIEQIFRSFVVNKFKEIQEENRNSENMEGSHNGELAAPETEDAPESSAAVTQNEGSSETVAKPEETESAPMEIVKPQDPAPEKESESKDLKTTDLSSDDEVKRDSSKKKSKKHKKHKSKKKKKKKKKEKNEKRSKSTSSVEDQENASSEVNSAWKPVISPPREQDRINILSSQTVENVDTLPSLGVPDNVDSVKEHPTGPQLDIDSGFFGPKCPNEMQISVSSNLPISEVEMSEPSKEPDINSQQIKESMECTDGKNEKPHANCETAETLQKEISLPQPEIAHSEEKSVESGENRLSAEGTNDLLKQSDNISSLPLPPQSKSVSANLSKSTAKSRSRSNSSVRENRSRSKSSTKVPKKQASSKSLTRQKSRSTSVVRRHRSRSSSAGQRRRSKSKSPIRRRRSRSNTPVRYSKSPIRSWWSRSIRNRQRSVSIDRRRRSRTRSVGKRRRSRSRSSEKRRNSRTRSSGKRIRSKSRSADRRRKSRSTSRKHKLRSRSASRRKSKSKSSSPSRKRKSKSASPLKRQKSKTASPVRRRRSRSPVQKRRSRSGGASRKHRSKSRSCSLTRRRRSRSIVASKRQRSRSASRRRRSRSPSISRRRRSRSPSVSRRRRSRSLSISRRRRSRSPSASRRRRSRSPSGPRRRRSRSPSASRRRRSRSTSASRRRKSRSPSISRRRRSRSTSVSRRRRSRSTSAFRRRRSRSGSRRRKSLSTSASRRRKSRSTSKRRRSRSVSRRGRSRSASGRRRSRSTSRKRRSRTGSNTRRPRSMSGSGLQKQKSPSYSASKRRSRSTSVSRADKSTLQSIASKVQSDSVILKSKSVETEPILQSKASIEKKMPGTLTIHEKMILISQSSVESLRRNVFSVANRDEIRLPGVTSVIESRDSSYPYQSITNSPVAVLMPCNNTVQMELCPLEQSISFNNAFSEDISTECDMDIEPTYLTPTHIDCTEQSAEVVNIVESSKTYEVESSQDLTEHHAKVVDLRTDEPEQATIGSGTEDRTVCKSFGLSLLASSCTIESPEYNKSELCDERSMAVPLTVSLCHTKPNVEAKPEFAYKASESVCKTTTSPNIKSSSTDSLTNCIAIQRDSESIKYMQTADIDEPGIKWPSQKHSVSDHPSPADKQDIPELHAENQTDSLESSSTSGHFTPETKLLISPVMSNKELDLSHSKQENILINSLVSNESYNVPLPASSSSVSSNSWKLIGEDASTSMLNDHFSDQKGTSSLKSPALDEDVIKQSCSKENLEMQSIHGESNYKRRSKTQEEASQSKTDSQRTEMEQIESSLIVEQSFSSSPKQNSKNDTCIPNETENVSAPSSATNKELVGNDNLKEIVDAKLAHSVKSTVEVKPMKENKQKLSIGHTSEDRACAFQVEESKNLPISSSCERKTPQPLEDKLTVHNKESTSKEEKSASEIAFQSSPVPPSLDYHEISKSKEQATNNEMPLTDATKQKLDDQRQEGISNTTNTESDCKDVRKPSPFNSIDDGCTKLEAEKILHGSAAQIESSNNVKNSDHEVIGHLEETNSKSSEQSSSVLRDEKWCSSSFNSHQDNNEVKLGTQSISMSKTDKHSSVDSMPHTDSDSVFNKDTNRECFTKSADDQLNKNAVPDEHNSSENSVKESLVQSTTEDKQTELETPDQSSKTETAYSGFRNIKSLEDPKLSPKPFLHETGKLSGISVPVQFKFSKTFKTLGVSQLCSTSEDSSDVEISKANTSSSGIIRSATASTSDTSRSSSKASLELSTQHTATVGAKSKSSSTVESSQGKSAESSRLDHQSRQHSEDISEADNLQAADDSGSSTKHTFPHIKQRQYRSRSVAQDSRTPSADRGHASRSRSKSTSRRRRSGSKSSRKKRSQSTSRKKSSHSKSVRKKRSRSRSRGRKRRSQSKSKGKKKRSTSKLSGKRKRSRSKSSERTEASKSLGKQRSSRSKSKTRKKRLSKSPERKDRSRSRSESKRNLHSKTSSSRKRSRSKSPNRRRKSHSKSSSRSRSRSLSAPWKNSKSSLRRKRSRSSSRSLTPRRLSRSRNRRRSFSRSPAPRSPSRSRSRWQRSRSRGRWRRSRSLSTSRRRSRSTSRLSSSLSSKKRKSLSPLRRRRSRSQNKQKDKSPLSKRKSTSPPPLLQKKSALLKPAGFKHSIGLKSLIQKQLSQAKSQGSIGKLSKEQIPLPNVTSRTPLSLFSSRTQSSLSNLSSVGHISLPNLAEVPLPSMSSGSQVHMPSLPPADHLSVSSLAAETQLSVPDLTTANQWHMHDMSGGPWSVPDIAAGTQWSMGDLGAGAQWPMSDLTAGSHWPMHDLTVGAQWSMPDLAPGTQWGVPDVATGAQWAVPDLTAGAQWAVPDLTAGSQWAMTNMSAGAQWAVPDLAATAQWTVPDLTAGAHMQRADLAPEAQVPGSDLAPEAQVPGSDLVAEAQVPGSDLAAEAQVPGFDMVAEAQVPPEHDLTSEEHNIMPDVAAEALVPVAISTIVPDVAAGIPLPDVTAAAQMPVPDVAAVVHMPDVATEAQKQQSDFVSAQAYMSLSPEKSVENLHFEEPVVSSEHQTESNSCTAFVQQSSLESNINTLQSVKMEETLSSQQQLPPDYFETSQLNELNDQTSSGDKDELHLNQEPVTDLLINLPQVEPTMDAECHLSIETCRTSDVPLSSSESSNYTAHSLSVESNATKEQDSDDFLHCEPRTSSSDIFVESQSSPNQTACIESKASPSHTVCIESQCSPSHTGYIESQPSPSHTGGIESQPSPSHTGGIESQPSPSHTGGIESQPSPSHTGGIESQPSPSHTGYIESQPSPSHTGGIESQPSPSHSGGIESQPSPSHSGGIESQPSPSHSGGIESQPSPSHTGGIESQPSPSHTGGIESQPSPSQTAYIESQPSPSQTAYIESQPSPSQTAYMESQPSPSHTGYIESQSIPSQTAYIESQSSPSQTDCIESQSSPSHTGCDESQSSPSQTACVESQPSPIHTACIESQSSPIHTGCIESQLSPSQTAYIESQPSPSHTGYIESPSILSQTAYIESQFSPNQTDCIESQPSPSQTAYIESQPSPSHTGYIESPSILSQTAYIESQSSPNQTDCIESQPSPSQTAYIESQSSPSHTACIESQSSPSHTACIESQSSPIQATPFELHEDSSFHPLDLTNSMTDNLQVKLYNTSSNTPIEEAYTELKVASTDNLLEGESSLNSNTTLEINTHVISNLKETRACSPDLSQEIGLPFPPDRCVSPKQPQLVEPYASPDHPQLVEPYVSPVHCQLVEAYTCPQDSPTVEICTSPDHLQLVEPYASPDSPQLVEQYASPDHQRLDEPYHDTENQQDCQPCRSPILTENAGIPAGTPDICSTSGHTLRYPTVTFPQTYCDVVLSNKAAINTDLSCSDGSEGRKDFSQLHEYSETLVVPKKPDEIVDSDSQFSKLSSTSVSLQEVPCPSLMTAYSLESNFSPKETVSEECSSTERQTEETAIGSHLEDPTSPAQLLAKQPCSPQTIHQDESFSISDPKPLNLCTSPDRSKFESSYVAVNEELQSEHCVTDEKPESKELFSNSEVLHPAKHFSPEHEKMYDTTVEPQENVQSPSIEHTNKQFLSGDDNAPITDFEQPSVEDTNDLDKNLCIPVLSDPIENLPSGDPSCMIMPLPDRHEHETVTEYSHSEESETSGCRSHDKLLVTEVDKLSDKAASSPDTVLLYKTEESLCSSPSEELSDYTNTILPEQSSNPELSISSECSAKISQSLDQTINTDETPNTGVFQSQELSLDKYVESPLPAEISSLPLDLTCINQDRLQCLTPDQATDSSVECIKHKPEDKGECIKTDNHFTTTPPDLLPYDSDQPTDACSGPSSEPVPFNSQPPPELLPYDSEQPANSFLSISDYSAEQGSSVFHAPPELLPYDSDQPIDLHNKQPEPTEELLPVHDAITIQHEPYKALDLPPVEPEENSNNSACLDIHEVPENSEPCNEADHPQLNFIKEISSEVTVTEDTSPSETQQEESVPSSVVDCTQDYPVASWTSTNEDLSVQQSVESEQPVVQPDLGSDSPESPTLKSEDRTEQPSLLKNIPDTSEIQDSHKLMSTSESETSSILPLIQDDISLANAKQSSPLKTLTDAECPQVQPATRNADPVSELKKSPEHSRSRSTDRKKSRSKSVSRHKRSRSKSVTKSHSKSLVKSRSKSRSASTESNKLSPVVKRKESTNVVRKRSSRSASVGSRRRSRSASLPSRKRSKSSSVGRKSRRKHSRSPSEIRRRSRSPSVPSRRRSPSLSRRRRSPSSSTRKKSSPSPSVTRRRRSISSSRKKRSPSASRRRRSPSPLTTRRRRSPSVTRRRRSPSPPVTRRRRSPSPIVTRRRRSPSPSSTRRKRSRSPSAPRRRRSPSPSTNRRRRSSSPSTRRRRSPSPEFRRKRSPSLSASHKRRSRSPSVSRKRRSRSTSASRRRRSRSASQRKRSRSISASRKRRSKSKSPSKSPTGKQSKSDRSRSPSQSDISRKRKTRSRSTSRDKKTAEKRRKRSSSKDSSKDYYSAKQRRKSRTPPRRKKSRSPVRRTSVCKSPVRRRRSRSPIRRKSFSRSPIRRKRSRSRDMSMDSARSPKRLTDLDKAQLLEIAKANAAAMCAKAGVLLPPSLKPVISPAAGGDEKITHRTYGVTIQELTEKCKQIAQSKEDDVIVNKPHDSDEEEEDRPFYNHPFKVSEHKPISFSLLNPSLKPAPKTQVTLTKEFPVSSGSQHRKKESDKVYGEWVPVDKNSAEESKDDVFTNTVPSQPVDITSAMNERTVAQTRLTGNPFDIEAVYMLNRAQEQIDAWAQSNSIPGQFTGSTGAQVLSAEEISNSGPQAWLKKDQLLKAAPVTGGRGALLMRKMGWREGEGLGRNNAGNVDPIVLDFKTDRKGLLADGEKASNKLTLTGMKDLSGKHPISALMELCNKKKWSPPDFELVDDTGPEHRKRFLFRVTVNGVLCQPSQPSLTKKLAKATAAAAALQALGALPKESMTSTSNFCSASSPTL
ncbi:protein SON isoform 2-T2 [Anomaloglossus baeobatrachus]|uniref:protein SON isoform X2 n=1 Tax=Anomaloglossus baeobatrachus TaxID=238106 RepID=UPI003F50A4EC